jgi:hypothetical protein
MKFLTKIFTIIGMSFLIACSEDEMGQFAALNNISASSSADGIINVSFDINSFEGVSSFSLAIVKTTQASSFTAADFSGLDASQTFDIQANKLNYSVTLSADQLDTDGEALELDAAYSIVIYSSELNYLSAPSASFDYQVEQFEKISAFSANEEFSGVDVSRITVSFQTNSSKGVDAFWVIVAKSQPVNPLLSGYVNTLNKNSYTSIDPSLDNMYALTINAQQLDTDGHKLKDGSFYKLYVYAKGLDLLSEASSVKKFDQVEVFSTVTSMWLHDINNNKNASDIRVLFDVNASRGIDHLSIALAKEESASGVSAESLASLAESAFTNVSTHAKKTFNVELDANQTDIAGNPLEYDQKYTVLVFSDEMGTLAQKTESILFSENALYEGHYSGRFNDNLFQDIPFSAILTMNENNEYVGPVFISSVFTSSWGGATDGNIKLVFDGKKITIFEYHQDLPTYKGGCPGLYTGTTGSITSEFNIKLDFTGNDCDGYHEDGIITFQRAWRY